MSTFRYYNAANNFGLGSWNWTALNVNAMLVSAAYGAQRTDVYVSDIPSSAIVVRDVALNTLSVVKGVARGVLPQFSALLSGTPVAGIVLYDKQASDAASQLIYYCSDVIGFPFVPQGFNYLVAQDLAAGGWFEV